MKKQLLSAAVAGLMMASGAALAGHEEGHECKKGEKCEHGCGAKKNKCNSCKAGGCKGAAAAKRGKTVPPANATGAETAAPAEEKDGETH